MTVSYSAIHDLLMRGLRYDRVEPRRHTVITRTHHLPHKANFHTKSRVDGVGKRFPHNEVFNADEVLYYR